ncbi:MAG: hypothetical protein AB7I30_10470 [Isosphaeraceae bacterium]
MRAGRIKRSILYLWTSPTTLVGLSAGALTLVTGGRVQRKDGLLEFHGGFSRWWLRRISGGASAMTLGHVILGQDEECLDFCREHEQVHVRQAEIWGATFLPAYVLASLWEALRGRHYYFDNWFEREARARCGEVRHRVKR